MKIRKLTSILASAGFAALLASCSDIAENERLVYTPPVEVSRAVLVEDFTGQRCVNCPAAAAAIKQLQNQYGENTVITVGIYSGQFGHTANGNKPLPLTTETGQAYFEHWKIEGQPAVLFNRASGILNDGSQFSNAVRQQLQSPTPVNMTMDVDYDETAQNVTVDVSALSSEAVSGKLQVWVLEDSIVSPQTMPDPETGVTITNKEYVHNHVFRSSVTSDIWGDALNITKDEAATASYTFAVDAAWKTKNLSIVAFVYNDNGVMQAIRRDVVKKD